MLPFGLILLVSMGIHTPRKQMTWFVKTWEVRAQEHQRGLHDPETLKADIGSLAVLLAQWGDDYDFDFTQRLQNALKRMTESYHRLPPEQRRKKSA